MAIFFVPVLVVLNLRVMGSVASVVAASRVSRFTEKGKGLDANSLKLMDADASGEVTRIEFLCFVLKQMEVVSEGELEQISASFRAFDVDDSGFLTREDLVGLGAAQAKSTRAIVRATTPQRRPRPAAGRERAGALPLVADM